MRIDLHCHSEASHDCVTRLANIPARCLERGISVQAITDHNKLWGAQELKLRVTESDLGDDLTIIVGEEITTTEGEIIGLFLDEVIPKGLSPEQTVTEIKAQGGLVLLPHGFDPRKTYRLKPQAVLRIAEDIDIVEAFNARVSHTRWNDTARDWANTRGVARSAGSDAHTLRDIGDAWVETPTRPVLTPADVMAALTDPAAEVAGKWTHPATAFMYKAWTFLRAGRRGLGSSRAER